MQFFALRALRAGSQDRMAAFAADSEWIGQRFYSASSGVALLSGFLLVWDGPWTIGEDWILIGLVLFALSFLAGLLFFGPESGRISKLLAAEGASTAA